MTGYAHSRLAFAIVDHSDLYYPKRYSGAVTMDAAYRRCLISWWQISGIRKTLVFTPIICHYNIETSRLLCAVVYHRQPTTYVKVG